MASLFKNIHLPWGEYQHFIFNAVSEGVCPFVVAKMVQNTSAVRRCLFIVQDEWDVASFSSVLHFIAPELEILHFPQWDCLPYDRVSPSGHSSALRLQTLARLLTLLQEKDTDKKTILIAPVSAISQKILPHAVLQQQIYTVKLQEKLDMDVFIAKLTLLGYERVDLVQGVGEFAVRGGLLDLFPSGQAAPLRIEFWGDTVESLRRFDPLTQKTIEQLEVFTLLPVGEVQLTNSAIQLFRKNYLEAFGAHARSDALYSSISEGRRYNGMEHWMPFFYEGLETLFDYFCPDLVIYNHLVIEAAQAHSQFVEDYYNARTQQERGENNATPYRAVEPKKLYLTATDLESLRPQYSKRVDLSSFKQAPVEGQYSVTLQLSPIPSFAAARENKQGKLFQEVVDYLLSQKHKKVLLACWSEGALERMLQALEEYGLENCARISKLSQLEATPKGRISSAVLPVAEGFAAEELLLLSEQDILGERMIPARRTRKRQADALKNSTDLNIGDAVVHVAHGIGIFMGLRTITALGAAHDCLELRYAGDDRLFLPIENIELLKRYGQESSNLVLDKLGGVAWQSRKAKLKKRLLELAGYLINIAAERSLRKAPVFPPPPGLYEEFIALFPYEETEDQEQAITDVVEDLSLGQPMDRLICGDVGFGKTEVALRAAFLAVANEYQVAVLVPTTLLARQHYQNFCTRFEGLPFMIGHASRFVASKQLQKVKEALATKKLDIVIGTHALLNDKIKFAKLGLVIIDEEQHFGVQHKERLKELKTDVHVLTLSATPIPRTLQLALTGVRKLSLISTPPVDRMAVRTFVSPFDSLTIREMLLREHYRGGQSFFVCPRVSDLAYIQQFLQKAVPELRFAVAHGQMPATQLEDIMNGFYDRQFDILVSTSIVESGLDIPNANTMIVYRADMFGLSALYQLRGRVGRSKQRAYALFTMPAGKILTPAAERRLKILQSLEELGAGFQLASHDLDIRGAGNLLGKEQAGHVKEVGFELYQHMLEEAMGSLNSGVEQEEDWSPQITAGLSVLIPENYVTDLSVRLNLYRRLAQLQTSAEIESFAAELIDRFGSFPDEVENLLKVMQIKLLCKKAHVSKVDWGPHGVVIQFYNNYFPNGGKLLELIAQPHMQAKLRPDQTIIFSRQWQAQEALRGIAQIVAQLAQLAVQKETE